MSTSMWQALRVYRDVWLLMNFCATESFSCAFLKRKKKPQQIENDDERKVFRDLHSHKLLSFDTGKIYLSDESSGAHS